MNINTILTFYEYCRSSDVKTLTVHLNGYPEHVKTITLDSSIESIDALKRMCARALKRKYNDNSRLFTFKDGIEIDEADLFFIKDNEVVWFSHKGDDFKYKQIIDKYKNVRKLGQGGFGKVYLCQDENEHLYAIKYIDISYFMSKADLVKEIFRESKTLSVLHHRNIISLKRTFLYNTDLVLIMEYAPGGELKKYVLDNKGLSELDGKLIFCPKQLTLINCSNWIMSFWIIDIITKAKQNFIG